MDALLAGLGMYAVNCAGRMAIRSGINLTASYTTKQCSRLLKTIDDKGDREELKKLRKLLNTKIKVYLIEFNSSRGNAFLAPAVPLAKSLRRDIESLGKRLEAAAASEEAISDQPGTRTTRVIEQQHEEMKGIIRDMQNLLNRIDHDISYLQLAISSSGETMSSSMPTSISPSRLLQASKFLFAGDCQFAWDPTKPVQIGPCFSLSLYMLFLGHHSSSQPATNGQWKASNLPATPKTPQSTASSNKPKTQEPYGLGEGERKPIWQEVMHKARIRLVRTPPGWTFDRKKGYCPDFAAGYITPSSTPDSARTPPFAPPVEYSYHLEVIEDLDDGRLHDDEEEGGGGLKKHQPFDNILDAGIRESVPIHQISKIFYTDTGKLLNIGSEMENNNPVLLLKRDGRAISPIQQRRQWDEEPPAVVNGHVEGTAATSTSDGGDTDTDDDDDGGQSDIDRQLFEDIGLFDTPVEEAATQDMLKWEFPPHLDQEWLALEVYEEDEDDSDPDTDSDSDSDGDDRHKHFLYNESERNDAPSSKLAIMKAGPHGMPSQLDNRLLEQIRNISICSSPTSSTFSSPRVSKRRWQDQDHPTSSPPQTTATAPFHHNHQHPDNSTVTSAAPIDKNNNDPAPASNSYPEHFVSRSPFGKVISTLSLMEMLIRLTSLQEFQQNSHLAIPDHILNFFLEETSTTGLAGEERWRVRRETRGRVGFDPYTDGTPGKVYGR